jgi:hypothetical protein
VRAARNESGRIEALRGSWKIDEGETAAVATVRATAMKAEGDRQCSDVAEAGEMRQEALKHHGWRRRRGERSMNYLIVDSQVFSEILIIK